MFILVGDYDVLDDDFDSSCGDHVDAEGIELVLTRHCSDGNDDYGDDNDNLNDGNDDEDDEDVGNGDNDDRDDGDLIVTKSKSIGHLNDANNDEDNDDNDGEN